MFSVLNVKRHLYFSKWWFLAGFASPPLIYSNLQDMFSCMCVPVFHPSHVAVFVVFDKYE